MKYIFPALVLWAVCLYACQHDAPVVSKDSNPPALLRCSAQADPQWKYGDVQLYPVLATPEWAAAQKALKNWKVLSEAMTDRRFRITEMKQFGREQEWYNGLTVQNRTRDTVFLMSGDVVQGGNQDRTIAQEQIVLPASVKNIEVFCVEHGRSTYYDPQAPESEKELAAFRGYYNVASPSVRKAVRRGDQQDVWNAVSHVTSVNNAASSTQTYTALDNGAAEQQQRNLLLERFEALLRQYPDMTGMVAAKGGVLLGVDVLGHPALFAKCGKALLHGYLSDAAARTDAPPAANQAAVQATIDRLIAFSGDRKASVSADLHAFRVGEQWVHLCQK